MTMFLKAAVAATFLIAAAAPVYAGLEDNGTLAQGSNLNGLTANGVEHQGISLAGANGVAWVRGFRVIGVDLQKHRRESRQ